MTVTGFTTDQAVLDARLQEAWDSIKSRPEEMDARLCGNYIRCDGKELSMTVEFPILEWEANYVGILHGGITATMLDHTAGVAAICFTGAWTPTVDIDIHYLRGGKVGDTLIAKAYLQFRGRRVIHMRCELTSKSTGKLVASALATYMAKATND
jgi:uncharacterized protein (TIGR00369 family)